MKKIIYIILTIIIALAAVLLIFFSPWIKNSLSTSDLSNVKIVYTTHSGWTGWEKTLTITKNGRVVTKERLARDDKKTTKIKWLQEEEIRELVNLVTKSEVFSYQDTYYCTSSLRCPQDVPTTTIQFFIEGREKSVSINSPGQMPESLEQILSKIDNI